jgi:hypothetical protein
MSPSKNIRDLAAAHAAMKGQAERVPDPPEALAVDARDGVLRGQAIAARYGENLALLAAAIAFGETTKSLHTRLQAAQLLWAMVEAVPEAIPGPPDGGRAEGGKG